MVALLRTHGLTGWRRHQRIFGSPDFVFRREKVALFVDGCFWHACPEHGTWPASNAAFWRAKLERNKERDDLVNRTLRAKGWSVIRVWQHDLAKKRRDACAERIKLSLEKSILRRPENPLT